MEAIINGVFTNELQSIEKEEIWNFVEKDRPINLMKLYAHNFAKKESSLTRISSPIYESKSEFICPATYNREFINYIYIYSM